MSDYATPVSVERHSELVREQTGWAFFDAQTGKPLLEPIAWDGQLWLVDYSTPRRARASVVMNRRQLNGEVAKGLVYVTSASLAKGVFEVRGTASSKDTQQFAMTLSVSDLITGIRTGGEFVVADTQADVHVGPYVAPASVPRPPWQARDSRSGAIPSISFDAQEPEAPEESPGAPAPSGGGDGPLF